MQGVSTMDAEVEARGDVGVDADSISVAEDALLLRITWLLAAVDSKVVWVLTNHKQMVFRLYVHSA